MATSNGSNIERVDPGWGWDDKLRRTGRPPTVCPDYDTAWRAMDALVTTSIDDLTSTGEIP